MMDGKTRARDRLTTREFFGVFPIAQKVLTVAVVAFGSFNFGTWVGSITSEPVYQDWLELSQPFTDAVADLIPAVGSVTLFLDQPRSSGWYGSSIPAVRNLLTINFAFCLFVPFCFGIAAFIDVLMDPERVRDTVDSISKRFQVSFFETLWRCGLLFLICFLPLYFGLFSQRMMLSVTSTIISTTGLFAVSGLFLVVVIWCLIAYIILRLEPRR